eukprot:TRINITY_DN1265_c0_g2_i2.p2 TRINITY_DN1265_c0_g2~~TRINITY_DN1265_c0_g2_i2.p2  ORF type:complete len:179 (+),score=47.64 TRINITY_DN1265_c0_g2_i2:3-539(+)
MGLCCAVVVTEKVDAKDEILQGLELDGENQERAGRKLEDEDDYAKFIANLPNIKSTHPEVLKIEGTIGAFPYKGFPPDDVKRILKDIVTDENGCQYYGFWKEVTNEKDGYGVMIKLDGSRYDGCWKTNQFNGYGRMIHTSGDIYDGNWVNGKAEGKGVYTHLDGTKYEGEWKLSLIHI